MAERTLKLAAAALLSISVSGCVTTAYNSQALADAKSWVGHPIQKVIKAYGEPLRVTGDVGKRKYMWKDYEDYSHDYTTTRYEQAPGYTPGSTIMVERQGTATKSGYYTCISEFYVDAAGIVTDADARGECR